MGMKVNLRMDRVIVIPTPAKGKGILLSSHHHKHYDVVEGTVVEAGPDASEFSPGHIVLYDRSKSQDLSHRRGCEIIRKEDICARI